MADSSKMKPGDLLEYRCPRFGIVWHRTKTTPSSNRAAALE